MVETGAGDYPEKFQPLSQTALKAQTPVNKSALNSIGHRSSVVDDEARQKPVRARTRELASLTGSEPWEVSENDQEQAKHELIATGAREVERGTPTP